jgi:CheY-like chemotaxis protein
MKGTVVGRRTIQIGTSADAGVCVPFEPTQELSCSMRVHSGIVPKATSINRSVDLRISLVVDDEPSIRRYITSILHLEHFQTLEAEDGSRALQIVQELGGGVDLIVSDIQMPNGDGLSLADAVKKSFPAMPVILVSGNLKSDQGVECAKKPFLPATLVGVVRKVFQSTVATNLPIDGPASEGAFGLSHQFESRAPELRSTLQQLITIPGPAGARPGSVSQGHP